MLAVVLDCLALVLTSLSVPSLSPRPPAPLPRLTRYLSSNQLGFLAQNYQALRHKHGITASFLKDSGFDTRNASAAHADVAAAQKLADKAAASASGKLGVAFVPGESMLARRRVSAKDVEPWGKADLLEGWHPAEVSKVRNAGTSAALFSVRWGMCWFWGRGVDGNQDVLPALVSPMLCGVLQCRARRSRAFDAESPVETFSCGVS